MPKEPRGGRGARIKVQGAIRSPHENTSRGVPAMAQELPPQIEVTELPFGWHYRLPRRPVVHGLSTVLSSVAFGTFVASWPALVILFFLFVGRPPQGQALSAAVFGPLV